MSILEPIQLELDNTGAADALARELHQYLSLAAKEDSDSRESATLYLDLLESDPEQYLDSCRLLVALQQHLEHLGIDLQPEFRVTATNLHFFLDGNVTLRIVQGRPPALPAETELEEMERYGLYVFMQCSADARIVLYAFAADSAVQAALFGTDQAGRLSLIPPGDAARAIQDAINEPVLQLVDRREPDGVDDDSDWERLSLFLKDNASNKGQLPNDLQQILDNSPRLRDRFNSERQFIEELRSINPTDVQTMIDGVRQREQDFLSKLRSELGDAAPAPPVSEIPADYLEQVLHKHMLTVIDFVNENSPVDRRKTMLLDPQHPFTKLVALEMSISMVAATGEPEANIMASICELVKPLADKLHTEYSGKANLAQLESSLNGLHRAIDQLNDGKAK